MPDISKYPEPSSGEALHLFAAYQRWVPILSDLAKEKERVDLLFQIDAFKLKYLN